MHRALALWSRAASSRTPHLMSTACSGHTNIIASYQHHCHHISIIVIIIVFVVVSIIIIVIVNIVIVIIVVIIIDIVTINMVTSGRPEFIEYHL
jgi:hypothetical protein